MLKVSRTVRRKIILTQKSHRHDQFSGNYMDKNFLSCSNLNLEEKHWSFSWGKGKKGGWGVGAQQMATSADLRSHRRGK